MGKGNMVMLRGWEQCIYLKKIEWFKLPKIVDPNTVRVFTKYLF